MINIRSIKSGFTLVEMLIAISLFTVVAAVSSQVIFDIVQMERRNSVQNVFYGDARLILNEIANYVQHGAIDYEEYFNQYVVGSTYYGTNYGAYAGRFYKPGLSLVDDPSSNPENLGVECSYPSGASIEDCEIFYTLSTDLNTGQNPFDNGTFDYSDSNALCDDPGFSGCASTDGFVDQLFLIDSSGTKKTILALKPTGISSNALAKVEMKGFDVDQNGIVDTWTCLEEYSCNKEDGGGDVGDVTHNLDLSAYDISLPSKNDLKKTYDLFDPNHNDIFVPITPYRANIKDLKFRIHPVENPYLAYAETDYKTHPSVTIMLKVGLTEEAEAEYPGQFQDIVLQTTVTVGVLDLIPSYPPTNDLSWMGAIGLKSVN